MNEKLMLITISGVQEFIAKSKKTVDFYMGSKIIMEILKRIIEILKTEIQTFELILPSKIDQDTDIPNYFIAKLSNCRLKDDDIRKILELELECKIDLNVYIVVVDYNAGYKKVYDDLYKKLESYKNNRFKDYSLKTLDYDNDKVKKINCTICGERKGKYISKFNKYINKEDRYLYQEEKKFSLIGEEEVLCEQCYKKRKESKHFYPSTIDLAVMEWREKVKANNERLLSNYDNQVKKCSNICISQYYHEDFVKRNQKNMLKELEKLNKVSSDRIIKASRYYALIRADIDNLGKHFSGKYLKKGSNLEKFQIELSNTISKFANEVKGKIEIELDKTLDEKLYRKLGIYLGGDDILFFCPLFKIFEMLNFIDEKSKKIKIKSYDQNITLSKSIVIAHDSIPLRQVIKLSTTSIDNAKDKFEKDGKNALAISLINSSFNIRTSYLKCKNTNIEMIKYLIDGFKNSISSSFISSIERQVSFLGEVMSFEEYEILQNIIMNEINRIAKRKINSNEEDIKKYVDKLQELLIEFVERKNSNSEYYIIYSKQYFDLLHILDKFSDEIIDNLNVVKEGYRE